MNILLIEDDEADILAFLRFVGGDHQTTVIRTAAKVVAALKQDFDLVVCDYFLPGAVDDVLIELIRSQGYAEKLVVMSGMDSRPGLESVPKTKEGYQTIRARIESLASD